MYLSFEENFVGHFSFEVWICCFAVFTANKCLLQIQCKRMYCVSQNFHRIPEQHKSCKRIILTAALGSTRNSSSSQQWSFWIDSGFGSTRRGLSVSFFLTHSIEVSVFIIILAHHIYAPWLWRYWLSEFSLLLSFCSTDTQLALQSAYSFNSYVIQYMDV